MRYVISIIVPVYYNSKSLPFLFQKLLDLEIQLKIKSFAMELIFIDDGSGDNSIEELLKIRNLRPKTKVIKLTRNFGAVHATKCGIQHSTGDCFVCLAADLQEPPELILTLVDKWLTGSKFNICVRSTRDDPRLTKMYATSFYWLLRKLGMNDYPKQGYDLALIDKSLRGFILNCSKNQYIPFFTYWLGFKPQIVHYHREKRIHGKSQWSFRKKIKASIDILLSFSVVPLRAISLIGLIVASLSFIYGIFIIISAILGNIPVSGFASIVVLISFLLSLIIIMIGVIGEYIWRIYDDSINRPEFVIDEIFSE